MKVRKPQSKRVPVRLRHRIEKASAAKQRKQRKLAKKNPEWRSRVKKDPGIPNLFPYKDCILHEIEEKRRLQAEEQAQRRQQRAERKDAAKGAVDSQLDQRLAEDANGDEEHIGESEGDSSQNDTMEFDEKASNPMAALLESARLRATDFQAQRGDSSDEQDASGSDNEQSLNPGRSIPPATALAYAHYFPQILEQADILLYVLDVRDPISTRSVATERQVASHSGGDKHLILVLNKIDLVPTNVVESWLRYFRRYHPTVGMMASKSAPGAQTFSHTGPLATRHASAEALFRALKAHASRRNSRRALTVGVVGLPNVGKSSVINALIGCLSGSRSRKATPAPIGAEAGITTHLNSIKLDSKLTLLDSPGVLFPPSDMSPTSAFPEKQARPLSRQHKLPVGKDLDMQSNLTLLSAIPLKSITNPIPAISLLLRRLKFHPDPIIYDKTLSHYSIPALPDFSPNDNPPTNDFLIQVARKRGRLGKGGVPNLEAAAMAVLADWRDGRIGSWIEQSTTSIAAEGNTDPKADGIAAADKKDIVDGWGKEFFIEGLWGREEDLNDTGSSFDVTNG